MGWPLGKCTNTDVDTLQSAFEHRASNLSMLCEDLIKIHFNLHTPRVSFSAPSSIWYSVPAGKVLECYNRNYHNGSFIFFLVTSNHVVLKTRGKGACRRGIWRKARFLVQSIGINNYLSRYNVLPRYGAVDNGIRREGDMCLCDV